jgi:hypothetical protein
MNRMFYLKNVGLWQPSILLPTPAPKCMWLSSGHVPLHDILSNNKYLNFSGGVGG